MGAAPMRAMVLAAGLGTRLRPLTLALPKPVVPVVHRPLAGYLLHMLAAAGIEEVALNTHHLPEAVPAALGDGSAYGLRLRFSHEPIILGTGGALRALEAFFGDGPCVLVNGDFLIELDLGAVLAGHAAARARDPRLAATMVVREDPAAERYGALGLDADGRVVDFVGRARVPGAEVARRALFTGVHVLEPGLRAAIPPAGEVCINRTAYPRRIDEGWTVRSHLQTGAWSDIGTPGGYLRANLDVLRGAVTMPGPDPRRERARFVPDGETARLGAGMVVGPASVADDAHLGAGAIVGPDVILGRGAFVGAGARVREAVLWPGAEVPPGAVVAGAILWRDGALTRTLPAAPTEGDPGR